jgi:hypothetical protein
MRITVVFMKLFFFRRVEGFKIEQEAEIKFCVKLEKTVTGTFEMLKGAYGAECLSRTSVSEWHDRFKDGRQSLQDDERKERPSTSGTEESTEVIRKSFAEDLTLSVRCYKKLHGSSERQCVRY